RQGRHDLLVLLARAGAYGVHEDAPRTDERRDAGEDLPLERGEARHVLGSPAPAQLRMAAERPEPAARGVDEHGVERRGDGRPAAAWRSTRRASGAQAPGRVSTPSTASSVWSASRVVTSAFARSVVGARSLSAASSAGSSERPNSSAQRATSQPGCDHSTARRAIGSASAGGSARPLRPSAAARRRTALTSPPAPAPATRARRPLASTAAYAGTRSRNSSW